MVPVRGERIAAGAFVQLLRRLPQGRGALFADDGEQGLETFREHRSELDVVIADMVMPGMSGNELFDVIRGEKQDLILMLSSGYSADQVRCSVAIDPRLLFLPKPWTVSELLVKVRDALELRALL